ncbi:MAG TPA: hypothetical protein VJS44_12425 [Pyrinomonadaceae bacterium]|nr:hypothetical protein [Pyrinomonadaceae bacterium]
MSYQSVDNRKRRFLGRPLLSLSSFLLAIAVGLISSFTFSAAYDMARASLSDEPQNISGVWHGYWNGAHALTVRLEQGCDSLKGTARFSRIVETDDGPKVIGVSETVQLINPRLSGDRLSFEVIDPDFCFSKVVIRMSMRFTKQGEAELWREKEFVEGEEAGTITMLQESSF